MFSARDHDLGTTELTRHRIDTRLAASNRERPRRMAPSLEAEIDRQIKDITWPIYGIYCQGQTTRGKGKEFYIGETERSLKTRFCEHKRHSTTSSEVSNHIHLEFPGHHIDLDEVKILYREPRWFEREIKETIFIKAKNLTLNKDGGLVQTSRSLRVYS